MMMEPGTLLPLTPGRVPHSGQRSAPPAGNALAPPNVLIPTYPSSTLNNYYQQPTSFISHDQMCIYLHQYPHLHCFL
jgi:hypothetical protein